MAADGISRIAAFYEAEIDRILGSEAVSDPDFERLRSIYGDLLKLQDLKDGNLLRLLSHHAKRMTRPELAEFLRQMQAR